MSNITRFSFPSLTDTEVSKPQAEAAPVHIPSASPERLEEESDTTAIDSSIQADAAIMDTPPEANTISEELLEAAKAAAFQEGYAQGMAAAKDEAYQQEQAMLGLMEQLKMQLGLAMSHHEQQSGQMKSGVQELALAISRRIVGELVAEFPSATTEQMLAHCLPMLVTEPEVTVTVHPQNAENLRNKMVQLCANAGYRGKFTITESEHIQPGDCQLNWEEGEARFNQQALWREIESITLASNEEDS